jgi:hypothetical protein
MPANIMLPTKAKMTAFVCSGRRRPKLSHCWPKLTCQKLSWVAMSTPTSMPTAPQMTEASRNCRTILSLNSMMVLCPVVMEGAWRDSEIGGFLLVAALQAAGAGRAGALPAAAGTVTVVVIGVLGMMLVRGERPACPP